MALQGTLETFALPDVLRLLSATGKAGCLRIDGDRGRGLVFVETGEVVHATADGVSSVGTAADVVVELLRFAEGSFEFSAGEQPPRRDEPMPIETLLDEADALLAEWQELIEAVPSLHCVVAPRRELEVAEVTISAAAWATVVELEGGCTVEELGRRLGQAEIPVLRTVRDLVLTGVVTVEEHRAATVEVRSPDEPAGVPDTTPAPSIVVEVADAFAPEPAWARDVEPELDGPGAASGWDDLFAAGGGGGAAATTETWSVAVAEPDLLPSAALAALDHLGEEDDPAPVEPLSVRTWVAPSEADDDAVSFGELAAFEPDHGSPAYQELESSAHDEVAPDGEPASDSVADWTTERFDRSSLFEESAAVTDPFGGDPFSDQFSSQSPIFAGDQTPAGSTTESEPIFGGWPAPDAPAAPVRDIFGGPAAAPAPSRDREAAEVARQLAALTPRAAAAVAAAAKAETHEEREAALARTDEPIDKDLLLKFLSSVDR